MSMSHPVYRFDGWVYDVGRRSLTDPRGAHVALTSREDSLIHVLCENPQRELSREFLIAQLHGGKDAYGDRAVDVHITRLRAKIEVNPKVPQMIKTIRRLGYWFSPLPEIS
jgi:two-component system OmpR family response regulator